MECARCHGYLIKEWLFDLFGTAVSWKCVNCGDITDPVILEHRQNGPPRPTSPNPARVR